MVVNLFPALHGSIEKSEGWVLHTPHHHFLLFIFADMVMGRLCVTAGLSFTHGSILCLPKLEAP